MTKYRALVGLSLPEGRVEEGEKFDGDLAGGSLKWLVEQGHAEEVKEEPKLPAKAKGNSK